MFLFFLILELNLEIRSKEQASAFYSISLVTGSRIIHRMARHFTFGKSMREYYVNARELSYSSCSCKNLIIEVDLCGGLTSVTRN